MRELSFLKGSLFHVYGLVVFDHLLFYSDWYTTGVYMVDMITGHQQPVAQHLSRPTSLVIYHPANLTGELAALFSTRLLSSLPLGILPICPSVCLSVRPSVCPSV